MKLRLANTQMENARLQSGNVHEMLHQTEQERDLLLEFIHNEMGKASEYAKEIVTLQEKITMLSENEKSNRQTLSNFEYSLKSQNDVLQEKNEEISALSLKYNEEVKLKMQYERDIEALKRKLDKRNAEADELSKMQIELLSKVFISDYYYHHLRCYSIKLMLFTCMSL
jgi:chromosome segregation ATPase